MGSDSLTASGLEVLVPNHSKIRLVAYIIRHLRTVVTEGQ